MNAPAAGSRWAEDRFHDALQFIAEGLTELVGFGCAVINVRRGAEFRAVAFAGLDGACWRASGQRAVAEEVFAARWPVAEIERMLELGEDWGTFRFIHHDHDVDRSSWIAGSRPPVDGERDAWHPDDAALAPILDQHGVIRGFISVDEPRTGRYPDAAQRRLMDKYAEATARVVLGALEREELAERLSMARTARAVIRAAAEHHDVERVLDEVQDALITAFAAVGLWTRLTDGSQDRIEYRAAQPLVLPSEGLLEAVASESARQWSANQVGALGVCGRVLNIVWPPETIADGQRFLAANGLESALHVPLGAGEECLGSLLLIRSAGTPWWSEDELEAAGELGADLGRVLLNAQIITRERHRAEELRDLDRHKSRMLASLSHELRNPLTVTRSSLELLHDDLADDPAHDPRLDDTQQVVSRMERSARRMSRLVDDLLLLAKLADPDAPVPQQTVDLHALVRATEEVHGAAAARRRLTLELDSGRAGALVHGDADELTTALDRIIDNALRFTPEGGTVRVRLEAGPGDLQIVVADTGIGIAADEVDRLFTGFFRSADPAAQQRRGGGLGLAIADRIVRRHGGHLTVTSTLREGSEFRIVLDRVPVADD